MGKSRGSQRTKGNAKPSSSGHSADLLNSDGKPVLGFVGFTALTKTGQHVAEDADTRVDGAFSMLMKKMLKRDTTTKLKALQEFGELCNEKDKDMVVGILPFWPRLFNRLSLDFDRRIREATHEANSKLIQKVKRDIAPYLRNIMGVWLLSQCDLYAPAASVAQSTFAVTFPPEKQSDALMFCKGEIIAYFKDNLFEQTPQSLSEPNVPAEEVENKYILVISGTLQGIGLFLNTISEADKISVLEEIKSIVSANKFWKHAKNKNPHVRCAWYNLTSILCRDIPQTFHKFEHKLGSAVLGCLSESDPAVAPAVWEAALHNIVGFENCWESIDVHKVVLPQLWIMLKEGGRGNAAVLYPCLLPLLSKLPLEVTKGRKNFFEEFFTSIRESLFLEKVKKSPGECNAIVTAFIECLQYSIHHYIDVDSQNSKLLDHLLCEQLLPLVESSFTIDGSHLPVTKLYPLLGSFVQMLETEVINEVDTNTKALFSKALTQLWNNIFLVCSNLLNKEHLTQNADLVFLAYFYHCLHEPSNVLTKKKKSKVRFLEVSDEKHKECDMLPRDATKPTNSLLMSTKYPYLFQNTIKFSKLICCKLQEEFEPCYTKLLSEIISAARCPELFQELLKEYNLFIGNPNEAPVMFFQQVIIPWIQKAVGNDALAENIVDVIFAICSCIEKDPALKVLNECCLVENVEILRRILKRGLSMNEEDKLFCKWLKSPVLGLTVVNLTKYITTMMMNNNEDVINSSKIKSYCMTVDACLISFNTGEPLIEDQYILEILMVLKTTLEHLIVEPTIGKQSKFFLLDYICDSAYNFFKNCKKYWELPIADDLMLLFFNLSMSPEQHLPETLKQKIFKLWQMSVKHLLSKEKNLLNNNGFIFKVSEKLHNLLVNPQSDKSLVLFLEHTTALLSTLEESSSEELDLIEEGDSCVLSAVFEKILPSQNDWMQLKKNLKLNTLPAFLERKLFYPLPDEPEIPLPSELIPQYILITEASSDILVNYITYDRLIGPKEFIVEEIIRHLPHMLWSFSYSECNGYLKKEKTEEGLCARKLQKNCFKMLAFLPKVKVFDLVNTLYNMCLSNGVQWAFPLQTIIEIVKTLYPEDLSTFSELIEKTKLNKTDNKHITAQVLIHHISTESKVDILKSLISKLLEASEEQNIFGYLAEVCCCLEDNDVFKTTGIRTHISDLLTDLLFIKSDLAIGKESLFCIQVAAFLSAVIRNIPEMLSSSQWRLVLNFFSTSLAHCEKFREYICTQTSPLLLMHQTCSLLSIVSSLFYEDYEHQLKPANLSETQWKTTFTEKLSTDLLLLFLDMAEMSLILKPLSTFVESVLTTVAQATEFLAPENLLNIMLESSSGRLDKDNPSVVENTNAVIQNFVPYLTCNIRPLQFGIHSLLVKIMPLLPNRLKQDEKLDDDEEEKMIKLHPLVELLEYTSLIIENMLSDVRIDECCAVLPYTDSYTYTMAYLLAWTELLEFFTASTSQDRSGYAIYLESSKLLSSLLSNLFRLMPENPASCCQNYSEDNTPRKELFKTIFMDPPLLSALATPTVQELQHVACNVYYNALRKIPALIRTWWNNLDKRAAEAVNRFTSKYVSGLLSSEEIQAVHNSEIEFDNMTIRARPGSREVVATYTLDDSGIELSIQLPSNYPLGPIVAERRGKIGISQPQWRHWLMQLTTFLTYQNGSILDGLILWKKNLDKKFEGVEECMICYYIMHSITFKLPKLSCRTCKKKFHSSCLYKWFSTSNNSTCPLCRNYF